MNRRLTSAKRFLHSGRKTEPRFSVKDGQRLKAFSRSWRCSAFIWEILIHAIFPLPKEYRKSASATSKRKFVSIGDPTVARGAAVQTRWFCRLVFKLTRYPN